MGEAALPPRKQMAKTSPVEFFQQVRQEVSRVTWPTRKETTVTTIMVFVMVAIASVFFLLADQVIRHHGGRPGHGGVRELEAQLLLSKFRDELEGTPADYELLLTKGLEELAAMVELPE